MTTRPVIHLYPEASSTEAQILDAPLDDDPAHLDPGLPKIDGGGDQVLKRNEELRRVVRITSIDCSADSRLPIRLPVRRSMPAIR
jgi:hypothetical protein